MKTYPLYILFLIIVCILNIGVVEAKEYDCNTDYYNYNNPYRITRERFDRETIYWFNNKYKSIYPNKFYKKPLKKPYYIPNSKEIIYNNVTHDYGYYRNGYWMNYDLLEDFLFLSRLAKNEGYTPYKSYGYYKLRRSTHSMFQGFIKMIRKIIRVLIVIMLAIPIAIFCKKTAKFPSHDIQNANDTKVKMGYRYMINNKKGYK